jgi:hypothetical protein
MCSGGVKGSSYRIEHDNVLVGLWRDGLISRDETGTGHTNQTRQSRSQALKETHLAARQ